MAQEIELKFIVHPESVETLRQHLHTLTEERVAATQLLNIYYETPDSWLRSHDMGLRIRGNNGVYEMTMKIAGRVIGGLHQRPEYNWRAFRRKSGRKVICRKIYSRASVRCSAPIFTARSGW